MFWKLILCASSFSSRQLKTRPIQNSTEQSARNSRYGGMGMATGCCGIHCFLFFNAIQSIQWMCWSLGGPHHVILEVCTWWTNGMLCTHHGGSHTSHCMLSSTYRALLWMLPWVVNTKHLLRCACREHATFLYGWFLLGSILAPTWV